jgi:hypothetical protein
VCSLASTQFVPNERSRPDSTTTFVDAGSVAVWTTKAGSVVQFDDLEVRGR